MPLRRSIVQVDFDDSSFKQHAALFGKYQDAVKKLPGAWKQVSGAAGATRSDMVDMTAALMAQAELLHKARGESERIERSFTRAHVTMRGIARTTKNVVSDLASMSMSILKWSGITTIAAGLAGAGGLWGLERMAASAGNVRFQSMGLGITPGQQAAAGALSPVVGDPLGLMGRIQNLLTSAEGKAPLAALGLGAFPGNNPAAVVPDFLRAVQQLAKNTDPAYLQNILQAYRLEGAVDVGTATRLGNMSPGELNHWIEIYTKNVKELAPVTEKLLFAWQELDVTLGLSWKKIELTFVTGLTAVAPQITELSNRLSGVIVAFLRGPGFAKLVDMASNGLERFTKYIATDDFATDVSSFVTNVGKLATGAAALVGWITETLPANLAKIGTVLGAALGAMVGGILGGGPVGAMVGGVTGGAAGARLGDELRKWIQGSLGAGSRTQGAGGATPSTSGLAMNEADRRIMMRESGGVPYIGYTPPGKPKNYLENAPQDQWGFPQWSGAVGPAGRSHAAGLWQFQPDTWKEAAQALGIHDFSPESQLRVRHWLVNKYGETPWAASEPRGGGGSRTALASAMGSGGGSTAEGAMTTNKHGERYVMQDGVWTPVAVQMQTRAPSGVRVTHTVEYGPGMSPAQAGAAAVN